MPTQFISVYHIVQQGDSQITENHRKEWVGQFGVFYFWDSLDDYLNSVVILNLTLLAHIFRPLFAKSARPGPFLVQWHILLSSKI